MKSTIDKNILLKKIPFSTCMDILDYFDDPLFEYIMHIFECKVNVRDRIETALPIIKSYALSLVELHTGAEDDYELDVDKILEMR